MFALIKRQNETKNLKLWTGLYQKLINRSIWNEGKLEDITSKINPSDLNIFLHFLIWNINEKSEKFC